MDSFFVLPLLLLLVSSHQRCCLLLFVSCFWSITNPKKARVRKHFSLWYKSPFGFFQISHPKQRKTKSFPLHATRRQISRQICFILTAQYYILARLWRQTTVVASVLNHSFSQRKREEALRFLTTAFSYIYIYIYKQRKNKKVKEIISKSTRRFGRLIS